MQGDPSNKTIINDVERRKRNISMVWIDYRKAFDSVLHSWIIKAFEIYKVHPKFAEFSKTNMKMWAIKIISYNTI